MRIAASLLLLFASAACATAQGGAPAEADAHFQAGRWAGCAEPEARQFDFWIGEWDVVNRNKPAGPGEWSVTGTATDRVHAVAGGCAIVEHWRGRAFVPPVEIDGFSVRAYDPERGVWDLVLLWPIQGPAAFGTPSGGFAKGRGDFRNSFVNPAGDSVRTRLSFSRITADGLQWNNAFRVGDAPWDSTWIMEFTRRAPAASGVWNGPSHEATRCPGDEYRLFDHHLGRSPGERRGSDGSILDVVIETVRILGGCAIMERVTAVDGEGEWFAVRTHEPGRGWVEYAVASDRPGLVRREARNADGELVFEDVRTVQGHRLRTRWSLETGVRQTERRTEPDGAWTPVVTLVPETWDER